MTDTWAVERRLDHIDLLLSVRGEVQRADLMERFGVSPSQASQDINRFIARYPRAIAYDKSAKRYVPRAGKHRSLRGWTPSTIRAMRVLALRGQAIGWRDS